MPDRPRRRIRRAGTAVTVVLVSATLLVSARLLSPVDAPAVLPAADSSPAAEVVGASRPDSAVCAGEAHRQFDFWRGSWVVYAEGERVGRNEIRVIAGGCGLEESWTGSGGSRGTSLNYYDPADGRWHQLWVGSGGTILRLAGGLEGEAMVMSGERTAEGDTLRDRITWRPLAEGRVRQLWEVSRDGGGTWTPVFDGRYHRK